MKAIKRLSLSEQVVNSIIQYIQENHLIPGDQLPTESEFAEMFQVSRTSIREAMKALSINGMFTSTPGKGTFLLPKALSTVMGEDGILQIQAKATITEIMEVRTPLEIKSIELAAMRATKDELNALDEIAAHYKEAVDNNSGWTIWGHRFHAQIAMMSGNPLLVSTLQQLSEMVDQYRGNLAVFYKNNKDYCEGHIKLCAALRRGDVATASEEMRLHMLITEEALKGIVDGANANQFLPKKTK